VTPWVQVTRRTDDEVPVVAVDGEIDASNGREVTAKIIDAVPNEAIGVVLDLSATTYLDSVGVHVLLDLAHRFESRRQQFSVVVPDTAVIRRVIELSHVHTVVPVVADCVVARAAMRSVRR
jgi:anti-sigma B factor antagonist